MGELESGAARSSAPTSISAIASEKLKSHTRFALPSASVDGLVDAFAEVFARIAASSSEPAANNSGEVAEVVEVTDDADSDVDRASSDESDRENQKSETIDESLAGLALPNPLANDDRSVVANSLDEDEEDDSAVVSELGAIPFAPINPEPTPAEAADNALIIDSSIEQSTGVDSLGGASTDKPNADSVNDGTQAIPESVDVSQQPDQKLTEQGLVLPDEATPANDVVGDDNSDESRRDRRHGRRDARTRESGFAESSLDQQRVDAKARSSAASALASESAANEVSAQTQSVGSDDAIQSVRRSDAAVTSVVAASAAQQPISTKAVAGIRGVAGAESGISPTRGISLPTDPAAESRSTADSKTGSSSEKSNNADMMSRIKLIQRVSKAFQHLGPDGGVVRLRLAPAELGTVRVEMRIQQNKVEARVVADTEAASAALREHLPELRSRLESFGLQVESLDVETDASAGSGDGSSQHSSQFSDEGQAWNRQPRPSSRLSVPNIDRQVSRSDVSRSPVTAGIVAGRVDVRL